MRDGTGLFQCLECDYKSNKTTNIRTHIETHHLDEYQITVSCSFCDYVGPSKSALRMHMKMQLIARWFGMLMDCGCV